MKNRITKRFWNYLDADLMLDEHIPIKLKKANALIGLMLKIVGLRKYSLPLVDHILSMDK